MSRRKLRLLNEILPTPLHDERSSSARERTLTRLAALMALASTSAAAEACKTHVDESPKPLEDATAPPVEVEAGAERNPPAPLLDAGSVPDAADGGINVKVPKRPKHQQPSYHVVDMLPDPALRIPPVPPKKP